MTDTDPFYPAAERRIEWLTLGLGLAGALFAALSWGLRPAAGVALGAALTWLNFRWLKQGVAALARISTAQEGSEHARVPFVIYVKFFGGFALLLLVVYVIFSHSLLPVAAVLGGLFAVVAAIMIEVFFELVRGRLGIGTHT